MTGQSNHFLEFAASDQSLGFLRAAGGIGAAAMAVFLAWKPLSRHLGRKLLVAVAIFGLGTILLGATRQYWVAFIAMVVLMVGLAIAAVMMTVVGRGSVASRSKSAPSA